MDNRGGAYIHINNDAVTIIELPVHQLRLMVGIDIINMEAAKED